MCISPQPTLYSCQFSCAPTLVSKSQLDSVHGSTTDTGSDKAGGGRGRWTEIKESSFKLVLVTQWELLHLTHPWLKKKNRLGENLEQEPIGHIDPGPGSTHLFPWFAALRRTYISKPSTVQGFEESNLDSPAMISNHSNALSTSSLPGSNQKTCWDNSQILQGWPTILVFLGQREFAGCRTSPAETRKIQGKLRWDIWLQL